MYKCIHCKEQNFSIEAEYLQHMNVEHKDPSLNFMCSACGKQFRTRHELTLHINSKCGTVKNYECNLCNKKLMNAGSLHNHMLRHKGEASYMCRFCAKLFVTAGQLKVHERSHTQDKAFICKVCGKGFCHRQSLITHNTIHTGIRPYLCENCGKSFSCVGNLLKHRKAHADTCGMIQLTTHRVVHPTTKIKVKVNTPETTKLRKPPAPKNVHSATAQLDVRVIVKEIEVNKSEFQPETIAADDLNVQQNVEVEDAVLQPEEVTIVIKEINMKTDVIIAPEKCNMEEEKFKMDANDVFLASEEFKLQKETNNLVKSAVVPERVLTKDELMIIKQEELMMIGSVCYDGQGLTEMKKQKIKTRPCRTVKNNVNNHELEQFMLKNEMELQPEDSTLENLLADVTVNPSENNTEQTTYSVKKINKKKKKQLEVRITKEMVEEFMFKRDIPEKGLSSCMYCNKKYRTASWLLRHELSHTVNTVNGALEERSACCVCKEVFQTKSECRKHQQDAHVDDLTCQECDKLFSNADSLRAHEKISHRGVDRKVYSYVCEKCGKQFKQKSNLKIHEDNNCSSGPFFECETCGKKFSSAYTRNAHMRLHTAEKKLQCKICKKRFHWKGQLVVHVRSHTGEKPFTCLYCPKSFVHRESLLTHSSLHTGIKPHLCKACGTRFSCIGNLIKHKRTHAKSCGVWYSKNECEKNK